MTVLLLATVAFAVPPPPPKPAEVPVKADAIEVTAMTPIALRSRLFGESGRTRVLNFWATWCGPCVAEIPEIVAYAKAHPNIEVVLVNLDLPKLRQSHVIPFVREHAVTHVTHLQLDHVDPAKGIRDVMPDFPDIVPITLVVDGTGTVTQKFWRSLTSADLASLP